MDKEKKIKRKLLPKPKMKLLTTEELGIAIKKRVSIINKEFEEGFNLIKQYPKSVTFFGSARLDENNENYIKARMIARMITKEGYAIVTGGGPGIMEAANRGSADLSDNMSLGMCIKLPQEQDTNPYVNNHTEFRYFFTRKVLLSFSAEAYIYFPGGFGTLDELFEILTLVQTGKICRVPIILVGIDFWTPIIETIKTILLKKYNTVNSQDFDLFVITNDEHEVLEIVKNAPTRHFETSDMGIKNTRKCST